MEYFYTFLVEGASKSTALARAKRKMIDEGNGDPFLWGAFVLQGDNHPLFFPKGISIWVWIGMAVLGVFFVWRIFPKE